MGIILGNNHMKEENYRCAVECYTKAIDLDLRNAVYYCNRYLQLDKQHDFAIIFSFAHLYITNVKGFWMSFCQDEIRQANENVPENLGPCVWTR